MRLHHLSLYLLAAFNTLACCADQDILTLLKQQSGLGLFTTYLELFPEIIDQLNNGTFTLLAPTDDALNAFAINNTDISSNKDEVLALLEYHTLRDTHPSALFGVQPLFPRTLLTNPLYANVTGGQRVELKVENGKPTILSGLKQPSHIVTPDIFFIGGLIHVIDAVLMIPLSFPQTITGAGLTDLVAILNAGGWVNPHSIAVEIVNSVPDLTLFGPNDPRFGATFTGFNGLSSEALNDIFKYSVVQGTVIYSDLLKNNTKYKTLEGESITITEANGGFYVDQALIKTRDYICANGVLQVLDQPLNPNNTGARPDIQPTEEPKSGRKGLSSAAAAGIGITIGVLLLGGAIVAALIIRNKKIRRGQVQLRDGGPADGLRGVPVRQATGDTVELDFQGAPPRYDAHELDNKALEQADGTYQRQRVGTTVVELRQSPSPTPLHPASETDEARSTTTLRSQRRNRSRAGSAPGVRNSVASVGGYSLNLRAPAGGGLPPSPPNSAPRAPPIPQEIDGQERSRISISITGEAPRHLGFQARY